MVLRRSCTRTPCHTYANTDGFQTFAHGPPCHPYAKMGGPTRTSLPPCHTYAQMDGHPILARDRHATHTPKWTGQTITTSMPPIRQICTLMLFLHATAMPPIRQNGGPDQNITTSMPLIRQNVWTNNILARNHHATHTSKWTDQSEHHYLHATNTPKWVD
jgi:hypothetical protein